MKRLFLVFTAFLGMIGLVGCDLISPEVVEQVSEQYCRDNPTADICQGESVGELQETAVIDVFNTLLDEYNDTTNTTFCEDYFSVTNIALLDECRASRSELFPEDISEWTVESATRQGALSTQSIYDVIVISPNGLTKYTFEVGLTMVEGIMYVDYWDYSEETIDPSTITVTISDAITLFQQFLQDYSNGNIASTTFCATYDPASIHTGCATSRDEDLASNLVFTYVLLSADGDSFKGEVTYTSDNDSGNGMIMVDVYYDQAGNMILQLETIMFEPTQTEHDYLAFVTALFTDFFYSTRSAEDICNEYFAADQFDFCMDGYTQKEIEGYTQEVVSLVPFEDHYTLTINTLEGGVYQHSMDLEVHFIEENGELKIIIAPDGGNQNNEFTDFITALIQDYQDSTIDSATICNDYFLATDPSGCIAERDEFITAGITINLLEIYFDDLLQQWFFKAEFDDGTTVETETQDVHFVYDENNNLKIKWDDNGSGDNYALYYQFLSDFVADYQDDVITSDVFCTTYFDPIETDGCVEDRETFLVGSASVELIDLFVNDIGQWVFVVRFTDGTEVEEQEILVDFYYDQNNQLKLHMLGEDHYQLYYDFLAAFINDYQDPTLDSLTVCQTYIAETDYTKCAADRDQFIGDGMSAVLLEFYPVEDGKWEFKLEVSDGLHTETIHDRVMFFFDENNNLKLIMSDDQDHEFETFKAFLEQFFLAYADETIDSEVVCNNFFEMGATQECIDDRNQFIANGGTATLLELYRNQYGMWEFKAEIYDGTSTEQIIQPVEFIWDSSGMLYLRFVEIDPNMELYKQLVENMIADFQNPAIPTIDVCSTYFSADEQNDCADERDYHYDFSYAISLNGFWPHGDGRFGIELHYDNGTEAYIERLIVKFFDENGIWKLSLEQDPMMFFEQYIRQYFNDMQDETISNDEFCHWYLDSVAAEICIAERTNVLGVYQYEVRQFYPLIDGVFYLEYEVIEPSTNDSFFVTTYVFFYEDNEGVIKIQYVTDETTYENAQTILQSFLSGYNDELVSSTDLCNEFFTGDEVYDCIDSRDNQAPGFLVELYELTPLPDGRFKVLLRYFFDDNTYPMEYMEEWLVTVYQDEFDNWKLSFERDYHPNQEFEQHVKNFVMAFNDDTLTLDTVCNIYFSPETVQECMDLFEVYQTYPLELFDFYQTDMGNFMIHLQLDDGIDIIDMTIGIGFYYDEFGTLWMHPEMHGTDIDFETAQTFLNQFVTSFNDSTITNTDFAVLLDTNSQWLIPDFRQMALDNGLSITNYWLYQVYGTYQFEFELSDGSYHKFDVLFHDYDGVLVVEMWYPDPHHPVTWDDAEAFIGTLVQAINNGDQIATICMNMFGAASYDDCYLSLEYLTASGYTIQNVYVHDMMKYWEFQLEVLNANNDLEYYSMFIILFHTEMDDIRGEFIIPGDGILEHQKQELLHQFLVDFNDGTMTSSMLCQTYFASDSTPQCVELFNYVDGANTGYTLDYWFVDFSHEPHYIEFAIRENGMFALEFVSFDVSFIQQSDGTLQFSFNNGFYYTYGDETLALTTIEDMILDFNDSTMSTESFCNLWSSLFDYCDGLHSDAVANNETLVLVGLYDREHHTFTAHLEMQSAGGTRLYDLFLEFRLVIDRDGYLNIWGWSERLDIPKYDEQTVQSVFESFIADFFDDTLSDEDFSYQYDYVWIPGLGYRQDMLEQGLTVTVQDTYIIHVNGDYQEYEAIVLVTDGVEETTYYIRFELMEDWDNQLIPAIFYDDKYPPKAEIETFINTFLSDIQNLTYTDDYLCDMYFGPWEDWLCGALRTLIVDEGQTLTLTDIHYEEWDNTFDVVLGNGLNVTLGVDYNVDLFGNRFMTVYYHIPFTLWDIADEAFYEMTSGWETTSISLVDLCQDIDCSDILNETKTVEWVLIEEYHLHPDYWMQYAFYAEIRLSFTDGTYQYVELRTTVDVDQNGEYIFYYKVIGEELPIPFDQTQLYDQDVVNVLNLFITDMLDNTIDAQTLCDTYFGTQMRSLDCVEGRQMYIDNNYSITLLPLVDGVDEIGNSLSIATFQFNDGTTTIDMSIGVRVYDYGDGTYYIWFVDDAVEAPIS